MVSGLFSLLAASYKGVSFYVTKESINDCGQRRAIHDYPKTGVRYAEPMGQGPEDFTVDIIFQGQTFKDDFEAFKGAMQDPNPGQLILPTFGVFNNMVAIPATGTHDHTELNSIITTVTFTQTVQQPSPTISPPAQEDAFQVGITAVANISNAFANALISPSTLNNLNTLKADMTQVVSSIGTIAGFGSLATLTISLMTNAVSNPSSLASILFDPSSGFLSTVYKNFGASTPPIPINSVTKLYSPSVKQPAFNGYQNLALIGYNLPTNLWEINNNIYLNNTAVSSNIPLWPGITNEQIQRNNNRLALVNSIRLWALIQMMIQAVVSNFLTVDELTNVKNIIDTLFNELIENDTTNVIIPFVKTDMEAVKNITFGILNSEIQNNNVYQTTTINLEKVIPATVLSYSLYGELTNNEDDLNNFRDILVGLNKSQPMHAFQGLITVLVV